MGTAGRWADILDLLQQILYGMGFHGGPMEPGRESPAKVNIDKDLLSILCCPETKQDVALAPDSVIAGLNDRIVKGEVKNKAGQVVTERMDGGLLRADKKILYPIREDIPVMLIDEGIPMEGLL
jgi:uncharacterized protein YbaR (Trm112 family)